MGRVEVRAVDCGGTAVWQGSWFCGSGVFCGPDTLSFN